MSGTLADIFTDSPLAGRLAAKTGTLGNAPYNADPPAVKTLSGYVPVDGGGAIEFSLLLNATGTLTDQSVYRPIWDRLADRAGDVPVGPDPGPARTSVSSAFVRRRGLPPRQAHERRVRWRASP